MGRLRIKRNLYRIRTQRKFIAFEKKKNDSLSNSVGDKGRFLCPCWQTDARSKLSYFTGFALFPGILYSRASSI